MRMDIYAGATLEDSTDSKALVLRPGITAEQVCAIYCFHNDRCSYSHRKVVEATLEAYGRPVEDKSLFALAVVKRSSLTKRRSSFALLISKDKEVKVLAPTDQPLTMANLFFRDDLVYQHNSNTAAPFRVLICVPCRLKLIRPKWSRRNSRRSSDMVCFAFFQLH
jgi:hypothetical protein